MPLCPKYQNLRLPHPPTRATEGLPCECTVCQIARLSRPPGGKGFSELPGQFKALLFPDLLLPAAPCSTKTERIKLCSKCFSRIARGKTHICNKTEMRDNLAGILKSRSSRSRGRVVSSSLKDIFVENGVSKKGGTTALPTGGKPIQVTLGCSSTRKFTKKGPLWDHDSLKRLQTNMNLSDKSIK